MKKIINASLFLLIAVFFCNHSYSQTKFMTNGDVFGRRVFIKNNGQFDNAIPNKSVIDYAYVNGDEKIYFNKEGVTFFLQKTQPLTHHQFEQIEHGKKVTIKPSKKAYVNVSWENSNPNAEIVLADKQSFYHSYGDEKYKSDCFKKIIYKNIYNNIDIEYLFTNEREDGIKYNVIVRPGGNINDVKIKYTGDVNKIVIKDGNLIIKTPVLNITELAPTSFQDGKKIASKFEIVNNIASFSVDNYDQTKELIIDPWVINTTFATNNYGYDVDYDYAGNLYVYGGSGPFLASKYSTDGVLLWTFNGLVPSISWSSNEVGNYSSNFIVDKLTSKTYIGQGFAYDGTKIIRLNSNGIYDNFVSTPVFNWQEIWDMGYRCSDGAIFGIGGSTQSNLSSGILNTTTGIINPKNFSGNNATQQDVVSQTIDDSGNVFLLFSSAVLALVDNKIMRVNAAFNGNNWIAPTNYNTFQESNNKRYPLINMSYSSNGYNALAANDDYLYYYNGFNVAAYNKNTGSQIGSTTVPGQNEAAQGGIAVDDCNNVYVGGVGFVKCFYFNGTTFTPNGTIQIHTSPTDKYITDIKLKSTELYVCGRGFAGVYSAINTTSCTSSASVSVAQTNIGANNTTVVATVVSSITNPLVSYTWLNSTNTVVSQTNNSSSLTDTVTNLPDGSYTVLIQLNAPCGFSTSQSFTIGSTATITPLFTQVASICAGATLAPLPTTSINGIIGSWSPALNNNQTTTYTFTPNAGQNATTTTMTIVVTPTTTPTFNPVAAICSGGTLSPLPTTSINGIIGSWSPSLNNTQTTTYTFTPTSGTCVNTAQLTITVNPILTPTFLPIEPICYGETVPILPTTSLNGVIGTWQPNVINNQLSGTYIFTPTIGQCSNLPPALQVTVYDDFDFKITESCIDGDFYMQVEPIANTFDLNNSTINWYNSNNALVLQNSSSFNLTNYFVSNSITPLLPVTFSAEVILPNGCSKTLSDIVSKIYCDIQKGISPNGDNKNEFFDLELLDVKKLEIFNRYGTKVYSKEDYENEWVGQSDSGDLLPDGTYYYVIEFNSSRSNAVGWIYINREK